MKKIAVATAGGDAPGMNAAIRSVVRSAVPRHIEVMGVFRGFWGLINEEIKPLNHRSVSGIINSGGTILKTARCPEFFTAEGKERAHATLKKYSIDGLVLIGGNGTCHAAHEFYKQYGVPVMVVAASIDNDLSGIDITIGSDTAINTALTAIDNIRDTATSMERIFVIEVMGRESGYIALQVGLAGGCEDVVIPEKEYNLQTIAHSIVEANLRGKISWILIVAEGAGSAVKIAHDIQEMTELETRAIVLGHIQRGGRPTAFSRTVALRLGNEAVKRLVNGETDKVVGLKQGKIIAVDLEQAIKKKEYDAEDLYNLIKILT